jgi:hypothetical protein
MIQCTWCKHPGAHAEVVAHDQPTYCSQCARCRAEKRLVEQDDNEK